MRPGRLHPDPGLEVRWRLPLRSGSIPRVLPASIPRPSFILPGMPCEPGPVNFVFKIFYLFLAVLGLCCCARAFSTCSDGASRGCGAWASRCGDFSCCGARAHELTGSVVVAHRLSCPETRGIFIPRPGIKSMSSALLGGFLTTGPPGKSLDFNFFICKTGS